MVSSKLYKLDSSIAEEFFALINKLREEKSITYQQSDKSPLKLYYDSGIITGALDEPNSTGGATYELAFDQRWLLQSRDGDFEAKTTLQCTLHIFGSDLSPFVCIFAATANAVSLADIINNLCGKRPALMDVHLLLNEHSQEIRDSFDQVTDFRTIRLQDDLEKTATIGGIRLENSEAWERYVRQLQGSLVMVKVLYNGTVAKVKDEGTFQYRSQTDNIGFLATLMRIFKNLDVLR